MCLSIPFDNYKFLIPSSQRNSRWMAAYNTPIQNILMQWELFLLNNNVMHLILIVPQ